MRDHRNRTSGVMVYFDDEFVFVTSTNFPYHEVGEFSVDYTDSLTCSNNALHVIPRRESIKSNVKNIDEYGKKEYFFHDKGYREIGIFSNGTAFSNVSNQRLTLLLNTRFRDKVLVTKTPHYY